MTLDKNSTVSKIYRNFYKVKDMPKSLCPYFWQLVIMFIFFIPVKILSFPTGFLVETEDLNTIVKSIIGALIIAFVGIILIFIISPIILIFHLSDSDRINGHAMVATTILCIVIFSTIIFLLYKLIENKILSIKSKKINKKVKTDSIILTFIKSKYNSVCPKITWIDNSNKNV
jgi:hypothetical protein